MLVNICGIIGMCARTGDRLSEKRSVRGILSVNFRSGIQDVSKGHDPFDGSVAAVEVPTPIKKRDCAGGVGTKKRVITWDDHHHVAQIAVLRIRGINREVFEQRRTGNGWT